MSPAEPSAPDFLEYSPRFLSAGEATELLDHLWNELQWSQPDIRLFGRRMKQPRLVAYYGEPGASYAYSGTRLDPLPWHPLLEELRHHVQTFTGLRFNAVLANAYRDGRDSMGWHADDERELGARPAIASLSLGAPRRFRLRSRRVVDGKRSESHGMILESGSLLLMKPGCQEAFQHALPRTKKPVGLRLNLTWRLVLAQPPD